MNVFKKKETLIQNMTYMAIMAAINVVFVILSTLQPYLLFLLILILPLSSTIVCLLCKKKYFIIYALVTIGLCLIPSISDTLFYVIPSIISGFIFGICVDKKIAPIWTIALAVILQICISYAFIPLVKLLTGISIIETFLGLFKLSDFIYREYLIHLFIFFLSIGQQSLSYFVLKGELPKLGYEVSEKQSDFLFALIGEFLSLIITIAFPFIYPPLTYLFLMFALYFFMYEFTYLLSKKSVIIYLTLGIAFFLCIFCFAMTYSLFNDPYQLIGLSYFPVCTGIVAFIDILFSKRNNKNIVKL